MQVATGRLAQQVITVLVGSGMRASLYSDEVEP